MQQQTFCKYHSYKLHYKEHFQLTDPLLNYGAVITFTIAQVNLFNFSLPLLHIKQVLNCMN